MNLSLRKVPHPLTPSGVARFGSARPGWVLGVQFLTAAAVAAVVVGVLRFAWVPVLDAAIARLPESGMLKDGEVRWSAAPELGPSGNTWLSLEWNDPPEASGGAASDLAVVFGPRGAVLSGLLGKTAISYPAGIEVPLDRVSVAARWGAWRSVVYAGVAAGVFLSLMVQWWILAVLYAGPCALVAFLVDRRLSAAGAVKMAAAGLMPGAWLLAVSIALYGTGRLEAAGLALAFAVHMVVSWLYLGAAVFCLPGRVPAEARPRNPFQTPS